MARKSMRRLRTGAIPTLSCRAIPVLRGLAVTTATRAPALPDVPAVGEFVPGFEASGWTGIFAPKNAPVDIIAKLNAVICAALADPSIKTRLADLGASDGTSCSCQPQCQV